MKEEKLEIEVVHFIQRQERSVSSKLFSKALSLGHFLRHGRKLGMFWGLVGLAQVKYAPYLSYSLLLL